MEKQKEFKIYGKVKKAETGEEISGLTIEALDKDLLCDDRLGSATTDKEGNFEIRYDKEDFQELFFDQRPDIYLRIKNSKGDVIHTTEDNVRYGADKTEAFSIDISEKLIDKEVESERVQFKQLIVMNPNYFGTFPEVEIEPIKPMKVNTKYEELRCIGFYPEQDLLEVIIDVKRPYGYKGDLCSPGSFEYVRFFVDWDGDGDFTDADEDVGIGSVNVHDIPDSKGACLDSTKPLSYAVTVKIDSKKEKCTIPNLVKVRAILSWDLPPPAGNPNYVPPWGNVIDKWVQIEPKSDGLVLKDIKDIIEVADLEKLNIKPEMLDLDKPILKTKTLTTVELKEIYKDKDVPEHRFNFEEISLIAEKIKQDPNLMVEYKLDPSKFSKLIENVNVILAEKANTKYEELHCVGLNYDLDTLVATLTVKLPYGYSGDLCKDGSYEYVGFWAYVWDQIEGMCSWKYLGTANVNVHDISSIPPEGLQYAVKLPVDLSDFKGKCNKLKVLKVRAILSWQTPPPSNNPYYNPVWGNKIDSLIQIKPIDIDIGPGEQVPYISSVGGMSVTDINSNGYANGTAIDGGFNAKDSPFGGLVTIAGHIYNSPNLSAGEAPLEYSVSYRKFGDTNWIKLTNKFWITITKTNGVFWIESHKPQEVNPSGYYTYKEDLKTTSMDAIKSYVEDYEMGNWHTSKKSLDDGLYEIKISLKTPSGDVDSNIVRVRIDNTIPSPVEVSITEKVVDGTPTPAMDCDKFPVGTIIKGEFKAKDKHFWMYSLSTLPYSPPSGQLTHVPASKSYPTLPASGISNGTFELDTAGMKPCGYVIYLYVWDRTIVNNHKSGNRNHASVGFCLTEEEE